MKKINTLIFGAVVATLAVAGSLTYAQSAKNIGKWTRWIGTGNTWGIAQFKWQKENKVQLTDAQKTAMQTALKNNDYTAFATAIGSDKAPDSAAFTKMVAQYNKSQAIKTAIANNDYNAYVTATTVSQEEFDWLVSRSKQQSAMQTAIKNNDYTAFTTALASDTNKPADAKVPTQEEFTKIVENSKNMPEDDWFWFGMWMWNNRWWMRGGHKGGPKWGNFGGEQKQTTNTTTTSAATTTNQ